MRVLILIARVLRRPVPVSLFAPVLAALAALLLWSRPCRATESLGDPQPRQQEEFGIEVIDAQAFGPKKDPPRITIDPPVGQVDPSALRSGVFADGTSVLVIRLTPVNWAGGNVTFEVAHTNPDPAFPQSTDYVGSLSTTFPTLPAPDMAAGVRIVTVAGPNKLVYYRPPSNFHFGHTSLTQALTFTASSGGNQIPSATVDLVRPTVFLLHGVMAAGGFMNPAYNTLTAGGGATVKYIDYWNDSTSGYDTTPIYVRDAVWVEIDKQRNQNKVAATRVDIFSHSMGGPIVKWYASDLGNRTLNRRNGFPRLIWPGAGSPYVRDDNFGAGEIRRLVCAGGPFQGSPLADSVCAALGYQNMLRWNAIAGYQGNACAYEDLGVGSSATLLSVRKHPTVSWCPIVGTAAPKTWADLAGQWGALLTWTGLDPSTIAGLTPANCDLIVRDLSQVDRPGGAFPPAGLMLHNILGIWHNEEVESKVHPALRMRLDLEFDKPTDPSYAPGYSNCYPTF